MKNRRLVFSSLLIVLALVAAACGDDDAETTTTTAATTTTVAGTTAATTTLPPEPEVAFDLGVTPSPCADAVNEGNGCIYLGVISDLTDGPFAPLGVPLTQAQEDFWAEVNAAGGIDGWDVVITAENTIDAHYDPTQTAEGAVTLADRVLGLAQSLGTPQTLGALPTLVEGDIVAAPATWFSGWAFTDVDAGLIMESGAPYCFEAMNGMEGLYDLRGGTPFTWALVAFPGDYGGDYGAGAKIAAAQLGLGDPVAEILQIPVSFGGSVAETVPALLAAQPDVIVMVTGPTEMAQVAGGLFQNGMTSFQILGAGPTWNVALKGNADLMPLLEAVYVGTSPWAGWDTDTEGHAAMRAAAENHGRTPSGSYVAGWTWQYPWLALLTEAIASGDLTRSNVAAIAATLEDIDYQGILPTRTYAGTPNDHVVRSTFLNQADADTSDGLNPLTDAFVGTIAADFDLAAPCFVG
ncbi:MAG: ABC transporter substrate-binding protein [Acidimicrobiia bacterium]|nr:ABC transporter substrate-binding protein [Acidimicrobiia bacterium]